MTSAGERAGSGTQSGLDKLALHHGISLTRPSPDNREVPISDDTKRKVLTALGVDPAMEAPATDAASRKPTARRRGKAKTERCFLPKLLEHGRVWGISLQLYELRSSRNWGIGDFADLSAMVDIAAGLGADFIGLNPLHAPFLADPDRCSPYEPSNRQYLNPLYIAVDRVPGFAGNASVEAILEELRQTDLVDYVRVAETKLGVLRELWARWRQAPDVDPGEFDRFVTERGDGLRRHALFEAISFFMVSQGKGAGWQAWPKEYRDCQSAAVAAFERAQADEVGFHMWLQWLAHTQLDAAASHARNAGLRIGLYLDLAVGEAVDGAATWSEPQVYVSTATIGSPPDPFAADGQDWHLAAFLPSAIASGHPSPYRRMLDATMRYAGAMRIDHAAAIRRLFLVPLDSRPDSGAYVNYPQADLLKILAEASAEFNCLVIGEDLGLLPEGLQDDLAAARILSYRILSYERDKDGFKPAGVYPALALACISTHDHQTLAGWWRGADIEARARYGILPDDVTERHVKERKRERRYLKAALETVGVDLPPRLPPMSDDGKLQGLVIGAHRFIARTPSMLAAVRLADLTSEKRPTNVPGTSDSYPNWKPKLSVSLERLTQVPLVGAIAEVMRQEREQAGEAR